MAETPPADYTTWRTSTFGDMYTIMHDGLPVEAVTSLSGDARSHAVRMLIFGLQNGDWYAATALAAMGETSALPDLRTALPSACGGHSKVTIAQAINHLSDGEDSSAMAQELVSVLETKGPHFGAIDAARGLRAYNDEDSEEALLRAVEGQDYLVSYHSCESLLVRWRVEASSMPLRPAIFSLIRDVRDEDVIRDHGERRREAVRLLNRLKR